MKGQEVLDMIMQRRSVRRFTGDPVTKEQLDMILKAAMAAPSGNNVKPWHFLVITEPEKIKQVAQAHPYARFGKNAGAIIIPFGDPELTYYFYQDMAAATENLLLMVAGLGLGATWCGMRDTRQEQIRKVTDIPEKYWIFAVIPIGVPAEDKKPRTQFDESKVHWEEFDPSKAD